MCVSTSFLLTMSSSGVLRSFITSPLNSQMIYCRIDR
jgi:hypothetical protein